MQLLGEFSPFIEKKVVFCLVVGGVTPLPPLSGPTTKKNTVFLCVSSLRLNFFSMIHIWRGILIRVHNGRFYIWTYYDIKLFYILHTYISILSIYMVDITFKTITQCFMLLVFFIQLLLLDRWAVGWVWDNIY